jgi:hypothetical protein
MRTNATMDERVAEVLAGSRGVARNLSEVNTAGAPSDLRMPDLRHPDGEGEFSDELANDEGCGCSKSCSSEGHSERDDGDPKPPRAAVLPPLCPYTISDGWGFLHYCRNRSIYEKNYYVERAVIVIHGSGLNAQTYYQTTLDSAALAGVNLNKTDIIAPQFLEDPVTINGKLYYSWSGEAWKHGHQADSHNRSSFDIIDHIINRLVENRPKLRTVVVAGQSAGGQFVSRYAVGTQAVWKHPHIKFMFWSANAGSYPWPSSTRPYDADPKCPSTGYNNYGYGLNNLNPYMSKTGAFDINANQVYRHIYWTVNSSDTKPDTTNCNALRQGAHRVERHAEHALAVWDHCSNLLGWPQQDCINAWARHIKVNDQSCGDKTDPMNPVKDELPGHGHQCVWKLPIGQHILFGDPFLAPPNG